jgi:hypothetical protein
MVETTLFKELREIAISMMRRADDIGGKREEELVNIAEKLEEKNEDLHMLASAITGAIFAILEKVDGFDITEHKDGRKMAFHMKYATMLMVQHYIDEGYAKK